jgi:ribosome maturation factor RimP
VFVERLDLSRGGVTVDELGDANHVLGRVLDDEDMVPETYLLEVSSPGVNRRIRWLADFQGAVGETVTVTTREPLAGRRKFRGKLTAAGEEGITVTEEGKEFVVPLNSIDRANLEYNFEARTENQG